MTRAGPDARRPLVFISHSGYADDTRHALDALVAALDAGGFTPLVDREVVVPGTDFHHDVRMMLETCDASVVLMNRRALQLESTWVLTEASALLLRRSDDDFQIIVLYVDDLGPRDLTNKWNPTELSRLDSYTSNGDFGEDARKIVAALDHTKRRVQAGVIEAELSSMLAELRVDKSHLGRMGRRLTTGGRRTIIGDPLVEVPRLLLRCKNYKALRDFVRELAPLDYAIARDVLKLTLPFLWVEREAAGRIPRAVAERRPIAINTSKTRTTKAYVHCASPVFPHWRVCELAVGFDGESVDQILLDAADAVRYAAGEFDFGDENRDDEPDEEHLKRTIILAVPCAGFGDDIIRRVKDLVKTRAGVGAVLQGGDAPPDRIEELANASVVYLEPEVNPETEARALRMMDIAWSDLEEWHADRQRWRGA